VAKRDCCRKSLDLHDWEIVPRRSVGDAGGKSIQSKSPESDYQIDFEGKLVP
jgi:hypothetical protein